MGKTAAEQIADVLGRAPEWVRAELASADPTVRRRAEETLTAMIAAALAGEPPARSG